MKGDILVEQTQSMFPPHNKYHLTYENMFFHPPPLKNHYLLILFIPMWDIRPLTDHGHGPVTYLDVL